MSKEESIVGFRQALREPLAKLEHEQWSHWILFQKKQKQLAWLDFFNKHKKPQFDSAVMEKWIVQALTPYDKLTEKEKESDRVWANKVFDVVLAEYDKAEQQWQKDFDGLSSTYKETLELSEKKTKQIRKIEKERSEQKKQLQTLIDDMPVYKYDDAYNLELDVWLKKLKKFVELNK